jgi:hypothetical protein
VELLGSGLYSSAIELKLDEMENLGLYSEVRKRREFQIGYIPEEQNAQKSRALAERDRGRAKKPYLLMESALNRTCIRDMGRVKQVRKLHFHLNCPLGQIKYFISIVTKNSTWDLFSGKRRKREEPSNARPVSRMRQLHPGSLRDERRRFC